MRNKPATYLRMKHDQQIAVSVSIILLYLLLGAVAPVGLPQAQYALGAALLTGHGRPKDPAVWWKAKVLGRC